MAVTLNMGNGYIRVMVHSMEYSLLKSERRSTMMKIVFVVGSFPINSSEYDKSKAISGPLRCPRGCPA